MLGFNKAAEWPDAYVPPPSYLTMPAVGIDVSDRSIKYMDLKRYGAHYVPARSRDRELAEGIIERGDILDAGRLSFVLKDIAQEERVSFVRVSLPEQKAFFFTSQVPPDARAKHIRQILEFQLEEHVPLKVNEAVFDYDLVPGEEVHKNHVDIGVTVYPRKTVEAYATAFLKAGLTPLSFEIEAQAIQRAVLDPMSPEAVMVIDYGETSTGISIVAGGMLAFTSTLDVCGADLTAVIKKEMGEDADIAKIKNTKGLVPDKTQPSLAKSLRGSVTELVSEIERLRSYWNARERGDREHDNRTLSKIVLCGGNANLNGLPELLSEALDIPVERASIWRNVFPEGSFVPEITARESLSFATVVGLALRTVH